MIYEQSLARHDQSRRQDGMLLPSAAIVDAFTDDKESRVLIMGSGVSTFPAELYGTGFEDILCVDFAPATIDLMQRLNHDLSPGLTWQCLDARDLGDLRSGSFDVIVNYGLADVFRSSANPKVDMMRMMQEVQRLLRIKGQ